MNRLNILASLVMDAFYQQYGKESDFFTLEDFEAYCNVFYYQVLQEDFDKTKREMLQMGMLQPGEEPILNADWYTEKEFEVKNEGDKFYIELPGAFSFNKDVKYTGLKDIYTSSECGPLAKITYNEKNTLKWLPNSDKTIYYYPVGSKIVFERVWCGLKKVNVVYIPSLDADAEGCEIIIPSAYMAEIVTRTYNFMTSAKNGSVIDKTNNQNPNKVVQTEIQDK